MDSTLLLSEIAEEVKICQRCELHHLRKNAVPGEGPADAKIMFIGEGPGFHENEQGRPFVGQAGKFLDELLAAAGLLRKQVFIANVVKCRPPGNRDPKEEELAACADFLERQIAAIKPRIIVTLGRFSMARYMPLAKISQVHGKPIWDDERLIVPMYHPAAALHQPPLKATLISDFRRLPEWVKQVEERHPRQSVEAKQTEKPEKPTPSQLTFF